MIPDNQSPTTEAKELLHWLSASCTGDQYSTTPEALASKSDPVQPIYLSDNQW
jgi:hypothetical protein